MKTSVNSGKHYGIKCFFSLLSSSPYLAAPQRAHSRYDLCSWDRMCACVAHCLQFPRGQLSMVVANSAVLQNQFSWHPSWWDSCSFDRKLCSYRELLLLKLSRRHEQFAASNPGSSQGQLFRPAWQIPPGAQHSLGWTLISGMLPSWQCEEFNYFAGVGPNLCSPV